MTRLVWRERQRPPEVASLRPACLNAPSRQRVINPRFIQLLYATIMQARSEMMRSIFVLWSRQLPPEQQQWHWFNVICRQTDQPYILHLYKDSTLEDERRLHGLKTQSPTTKAENAAAGISTMAQNTCLVNQTLTTSIAKTKHLVRLSFIFSPSMQNAQNYRKQSLKHRNNCESALWAKSALFKVSFY